MTGKESRSGEEEVVCFYQIDSLSQVLPSRDQTRPLFSFGRSKTIRLSVHYRKDEL